MKLLWDLEQGSEEWLDWRRKKFTASDAAVIMGDAPSYSSVKTWEELSLVKAGLGQPPSKFMTRAFDHGTRLEPKARRLFAPYARPVCVESDAWDLFAASLDGLDQVNKIWYEIKCPISRLKSRVLKDVKIGKVPNHIWWQMVHQAGVMKEWEDFAEYRCRLIIYMEEEEESGILEISSKELIESWNPLYIRWLRFKEGKKEWECPAPPSKTRRNPEWIRSVIE